MIKHFLEPRAAVQLLECQRNELKNGFDSEKEEGGWINNWRARRDSNPRPLAPEANALSI